MSNDYFISIQARPNKGLRIKGTFKVPYQQHGITAHDAQVLKHIILVVTRSGNYHAVAPFKNVIVFPDDIKNHGDHAAGFFNISIQNHIEFDDKGDYYILCSLGTFLSNIIKIRIDEN